MTNPAIHSHCAWCSADSQWTVGPWLAQQTPQSPIRMGQDVCLNHVIPAIAQLFAEGSATVIVGQLYRP